MEREPLVHGDPSAARRSGGANFGVGVRAAETVPGF